MSHFVNLKSVQCIAQSAALFSLSVLILSVTILACGTFAANGLSEKKAKLAAELGVNPQVLDHYPYFPLEYFLEVLKPGMSRRNVHEVVRGYERVLRCGDYAEVYYYYSKSDREALRLEIIYDEQGRFRETRGEDPNSRTIPTRGCILGKLRE